MTLNYRDFVLVAVGDEIHPDLTDKAARIVDDLSLLVASLCEGRYWKRNSDGSASEVPLADPERFTKVIEALGWGSLRIGRVGITEDDLHSFLDEEASRGASFDVTSSKNALVAVSTALLVARGACPIYTFELKRKPTYGQYDLLPALEHSQYVYRDLSSVPLLARAVKKVNAYRLDRRAFLLVSVGVGAAFALVTLSMSQTVVFSLLTGFASFASIVSALSFFLRE
jgi:hypothetical protein